MAVSKIHVMLGQHPMEGFASMTYLTQNQDPQEGWYLTATNVALWNLATAALVYPWVATASNNWKDGAASASLGVTTGPDLSFLREVARDLEPTNFHCSVKATGDGTLRAGSPTALGRWDKIGADYYPDIITAVTAAKAALEAALPANDVEIGSISVAFGNIEADDYDHGTPWLLGALNFQADLTLLVNNLRADLAALTGQTASDIPAILLRLPTWTRAALGGPYANVPVDFIRDATIGVQRSLANVAVANLDQTEYHANQKNWSAHGAIAVGNAMAVAYQRLTDAAVPSAIDGGIPVIIYVGQSNVGGATPTSWLAATANGDPELVQDYAGKVFTYAWATDEVQQYFPEYNSNSGPDPAWNTTGNFGPDVGATPGLLDRHAATGLCWFKLGVASASLGVNTGSDPIWLAKFAGLPGAVWEEYVAGWRSFVSKVVDATGKSPHVRLIIVHQGEGDTEAALHPLYADHLREFISDLRELHAIDTHSADTIPVGIVKTKAATGHPWLAAGMTAVRAAQVAVAAEAGNFLVDVDNTASRTDHVHDSGEGTIDVGRAISAALPAWYDSGEAV